VTTTRLGDLPRVLPADPSWITSAPHLPDVLHLVADAAEVNSPGTYLLETTASWIAAETLGRIGAAVTEAPIDSMIRIMALPMYQLRALQRVRVAVHRALDREPDAERLLELLDLLFDYRGLTPAGLAEDLDRILAVLDLDTPAVWTIASAHLTGGQGTAWQTTYQQVTAAWRAAGVPFADPSR